MGYKEKQIINKILIDGSKKGRLFRANSGKAHAGKLHHKYQEYDKKTGKYKHYTVIENAHYFHGFPEGTPDVIGWERKTLCEIIKDGYLYNHPCKYYKNKKNDKSQCVLCGYNKKIAIFKAVEVKTGKQQLTEQQKRFRDKLIKDGGIYEECRE